jgi:hypothetical protein
MGRKKQSSNDEETSSKHVRDLKNAMYTIETTCGVLIDLMKEEQVLHRAIKQVKKSDITQIIKVLTTFSTMRTQTLRKFTNKRYYSCKRSVVRAKNGKKLSLVEQWVRKLI